MVRKFNGHGNNQVRKAIKRLNNRNLALRTGILKPVNYHDYAVLNPELVETIFNTLK